MRKFALSSSSFPRHKLAQAIHHTSLAGFKGIEIIADAPHAYPPHLNEADRLAVRTALTENHLAISNLNANPMCALRDENRPCWIECDHVLRRERIDHTIDALKLAHDLGAPSVSTIAGGILEDGMPREQAIKHFTEGVREVASSIERKKYPPLLITPRPEHIIKDSAAALEIIALVKSKSVGVNFNTAHFRRAGTNVAEEIRKLAGHILHVTISDVAADGSATVPGKGSIDFAAVFAALDETNFSGWLTVCLADADAHPDEAAREALLFLGRFDK